MRRTLAIITCVLPVLLAGGPAAAHIKWFYPYDVSTPPRSMGDVLNPDFVLLFLLSASVIFCFFLVDRYLHRIGFLAKQLARLAISEPMAFLFLRYATAVLFLKLAIYGWQSHDFYLTPELHTSNPGAKWVQLIAALGVIYRWTLPVTGLAVAALYGFAIMDYGLYHLLDYVIFPGLSFFFLFALVRSPVMVAVRYAVLFGSTGVTLLWGAVEKWAYPQWTYPLLRDHPELVMDFSPEFYMQAAGFVEFNIAFMILFAIPIVSRLAALGLNALFILAIYIFGMIDAVGHLIIIAVLFVLALRGPTYFRNEILVSEKSLPTQAVLMTGLYFMTIMMMFIAYYGLHHLLVG